ncbi:MAG: histidinol-phosphatase HisJ family protein [Alphaproteobacteria bacterium]|nr:histidinol-phosphatase HisJ family protein [Alphaproteobacteria bacterium]
MLKVQNFSYHNHTNFSDGKCSLKEMVEQAKKIGFCEMGISDHLIVHKNIEQSPSWPKLSGRYASTVYRKDFKKCLPEFQRHCEEIRKISKQEKIKLYVGFEVDFFTYEGWLEELKEFLSQLDYDYLVSGNHFMSNEKGDTIINIDCIKGITDTIKDLPEYIANHFGAMKKSAESGLYSFLAHIDYIRKLGDNICGPHQYVENKIEVLKVLQENNMGIEISTKGLRKINDFYPCSEILDKIAELGIKTVISDDAHNIDELGSDFEKAEKELTKHNITHRLKF